ncbi:hypothetical protein B7494_g4080 [Chlorociboria aeruginascens]|nr:hypothetical protein B7494_g4080 [Chlorociboria aeruginascens]
MNFTPSSPSASQSSPFTSLQAAEQGSMRELTPAVIETNSRDLPSELRYIQYDHSLEKQYLPAVRALISKDLSEPYSIYVYRYFLYQWGDLCFMAGPFHLPIRSTLTNTGLAFFNTQPPWCHHLQARKPPVALPSHVTRVHRHARRVLYLPQPRDRNYVGEESD